MRRTPLLFLLALPVAAAAFFGKSALVREAVDVFAPAAPDRPAYAAPPAPAGASPGGGEADLLALMRAASVDEGAKVFRRCGACHKLDPTARALGPHLVGVVGRPVGAVPGFDYSEALAALEARWTPESLSAFLADPKGWAPGTAKTLAPMEDAADRAAVIVYLNAIAPEPAPIFAVLPVD